MRSEISDSLNFCQFHLIALSPFGFGEGVEFYTQQLCDLDKSSDNLYNFYIWPIVPALQLTLNHALY